MSSPYLQRQRRSLVEARVDVERCRKIYSPADDKRSKMKPRDATGPKTADPATTGSAPKPEAGENKPA